MLADLARFVRPGDGVLWGQGCAEPQTLVEAFVEQRTSFSGARVFLGISYSGLVRPEHADHLKLSSYCGIGKNRALCDARVVEIFPQPYSRLAGMIRSGQIPVDVVFVQVSPPSARGEYSLGLAADYLVPALEKARVVVGEVNARVPWTHTEKLLRRAEFSHLVESSREPAPAPASRVGDLDTAIGRHASAFVPDGAVLEFGIGALPDAVCAALVDRKGLRVHSGTVGDGVADLMKRGVVTHADCAVLTGSRALFEHARENASIRLRSSEYTHDPRVLAGLPKFVAVNSAVEVDLTGQLNSEIARGSYVGAVGGAPDFARAANQSDGGVSLVLIPAARIVEKLSGPVSVGRSDIGVVVTENGAADLRGLGLAARREKLLAIAGSPQRERRSAGRE